MRNHSSRGVVHSAEIAYAMGNLAINKYFGWEPANYKVFPVMQDYFVNGDFFVFGVTFSSG
jgi:para-nitrobenzyl esterase